MTHAIAAQLLEMTYRVPVRETGVRAAIRSLVRRQTRAIPAVQSITFHIAPGERVSLIGPNGAGKTTTLKMLCGVLTPTGGQAHVLGFIPWRRETAFLRQIALIRGSRPIGAPVELTVLDALRFQQLIYDVREADFSQTLADLTAFLELEPLLPRQIRALSLGERARVGLAWSLIYRPRVLFLDEPTLGLDVSAITAFRQFIMEYNQRTGATIILTSHNMTDVTALCPRVLLIQQGSLLFDGALEDLAAAYTAEKIIGLTLTEPTAPDWEHMGLAEFVVEASPQRVRLRIPRLSLAPIVARLLDELPVADVTIEEPPLETIIDRIYRSGEIAV